MQHTDRFCLPLLLLLGLTCRGSAQELVFHRRASQLHDTAHQVIRCDLGAERVIRQQGQVVDKSTQTLRRVQERTLTILGLDGTKPVQARIDYGESVTQVEGQESAPVKVTHPVAGKSYFAALRDDQLVLRNAQGEPPTPEEEEILRLHLATFGQPNPLAQFLDGQTIRLGDAIVVPDDVARELLGLTGRQGATDQLTLRLADVVRIEGHACGVFETILRTAGLDTSVTMLMRGRLVIEAATCRTRSIHLQGPVAMSETRGPALGRFVVSTNGTLQVSVEASFPAPKGTAERASLPRTAAADAPHRK